MNNSLFSRKNHRLLSVFLVSCFLFSCKKDNNPSGTNSSFLPKTYTEDVRSSIIGNSVTTYDLTYDGNNRLLAITSTPAPPLLNFIYKYPADKSVTLDMYENGELSIHEIFWLNNASFVDSTLQFEDSNDSTSEKYIYNASNQLVQQKTYDYFSSGPILNNTTNFTYDNSGNVAESVDDQGTTTTYSYYTDLANTLNMGQTFLPQTVNFVKTVTASSSSYTETATHYYTFDSNNRILTDSAVSTGAVDITAIKSYTY